MAMLTFFALIKNKNSVSNSKDLFPYNSLASLCDTFVQLCVKILSQSTAKVSLREEKNDFDT